MPRSIKSVSVLLAAVSARVLGQAFAVLYLAYLWHQALLVAGGAGGHAACALMGSVPLLLLAKYLGKEQVRSRFN